MRLKRAFSLIEVLLVMGIIAVVTAMGFSISKSSMEKAHNMFWYTGYETLYKVTIDAVQRQKIDGNGNYVPVFDPENPNIGDYANHLAKMINAPSPTNCGTGGGVSVCKSVEAPNGIKYEIKKFSAYSELYKIDMTIPALRQRRGYLNKTRFIYMFNNSNDEYINGMVYPADITDTDYINLQNRVDLLTFYLSDGTNNTSTNRTFFGFRDAYCHAHYRPGEQDPEDPDSILPNTQYLGYQSGNWDDASVDCRTGYTQDDNFLGFSVYPISPRKAF